MPIRLKGRGREGGTQLEHRKQTSAKREQNPSRSHHLYFDRSSDTPRTSFSRVSFLFWIRPHKSFDRNGNDLIYKSTVSLADALTDYILEVRHPSDSEVCLAHAGRG